MRTFSWKQEWTRWDFFLQNEGTPPVRPLKWFYQWLVLFYCTGEILLWIVLRACIAWFDLMIRLRVEDAVLISLLSLSKCIIRFGRSLACELSLCWGSISCRVWCTQNVQFHELGKMFCKLFGVVSNSELLNCIFYSMYFVFYRVTSASFLNVEPLVQPSQPLLRGSGHISLSLAEGVKVQSEEHS